MRDLPIRQVHLDFHTSPLLPGVGSKFDKKQFQEALKKGNVQSITVFAKCHHSMCYYPTKYGTMHPSLDFDLTGAMVEAAHEIGVRAPIYITAGWSEEDAKKHPEWISVKPDGNMAATGAMAKAVGKAGNQPIGDCAWNTLCLNDGSYCQHIYDLTEEVCQRYKDIDGLFYDICGIGKACICDDCVAGMKAMGMDPTNLADQEKYNTLARQNFMRKCGEIMRKYHPNATIFFNSGGAHPEMPQYHPFQTHYEMEDLPTAWGGYDKLPLRAKFFRRLGKPYLGMTGKFHLAWGEFGGFKCKEALKYEVCAMAMQGAGCSIGDHMHPDGEMEMQTYENIGYAYDYLEKIAPYCYGGESTARLGMLYGSNGLANQGVSMILAENQIDFDLIHDNNFSRFDTVILPEGSQLDEAGLAALKDYIAKGGKVLMCGDALVKDGAFQIDCGAEYIGKAEFDCDYLSTDLSFEQELPNAPMLSNLPGQHVRLTDGEALAQITLPYFSRTVAHHCGHKNTPHNKDGKTLPGIVRKGNVVYTAHSLASLYNTYGSLYHKRYFMLALKQLNTGGAFEVSGMGSMGKASMIHQTQQNRYCLNLLYASPIRKGCAEIIEDIMPVYNIAVTLDIPQKIKKVYLPLTGETLVVTETKGAQTFILPKLDCHASIVLEY